MVPEGAKEIDARAARGMDRQRRWVLAILVLVAMCLLVDAAMLHRRFPLPEDPIVADEFVEAAEALAPPRAHSVIVGMAARSVTTPEMPTLFVTGDTHELLDIPGEEVGSRFAPTISPWLMQPLLAGGIVFEAYDPILDEATVERLLAGDPLSFARDVYVVEPTDGTAELRLFLGPDRRRVFLLPADADVDSP